MKQIVVQSQAVGFCRFHQRIDDCTRLRTLGCIGKEPSLPADNKRADGVFNLVVADFNLTMLKKRAEVCLLILSIRNSVLQLACRTGNRIQPFPVRFENRSRLLLALDEAFFCGTAAEVTPVREVDGRTIGEGHAGPVTKAVQKAFFEVVDGTNGKYADWLAHYSF